MAEITRETIRCIEEAAAREEHFPLTIWEKVQLARAWAECEDIRDVHRAIEARSERQGSNEKDFGIPAPSIHEPVSRAGAGGEAERFSWTYEGMESDPQGCYVLVDESVIKEQPGQPTDPAAGVKGIDGSPR